MNKLQQETSKLLLEVAAIAHKSMLACIIGLQNWKDSSNLINIHLRTACNIRFLNVNNSSYNFDKV